MLSVAPGASVMPFVPVRLIGVNPDPAVSTSGDVAVAVRLSAMIGVRQVVVAPVVPRVVPRDARIHLEQPGGSRPARVRELG